MLCDDLLDSEATVFWIQRRFPAVVFKRAIFFSMGRRRLLGSFRQIPSGSKTKVICENYVEQKEVTSCYYINTTPRGL